MTSILPIYPDNSWGESIIESLENNIDDTITIHPGIKYTESQNIIPQIQQLDYTGILFLGLDDITGLEIPQDIKLYSDKLFETESSETESSETESETESELNVTVPVRVIPPNIINESLPGSYAVYDGIILLGGVITSDKTIHELALNQAAALHDITLNEYGDLAYVTYEINETTDTITISNTQLNSLDVLVFHDLNENGIKDSDEPGIQTDVLILTVPVSTGYTNQFGEYSFIDPPRGPQFVYILLPEGYKATGAGWWQFAENTAIFPLVEVS